MDVNGLPLWQFAGPKAFGVATDSAAPNRATGLAWRADRAHLKLAVQADAPSVVEDETFARLMASTPALVADDADTFAWWNADEKQIEASGFAPGSVAINLGPDDKPEAPPSIFAPTDMAMGEDQILYIVRDGTVILRDMRDRYPTSIAKLEGFTADLVAPRPGGGAWTFDKGDRRLGIVRGLPLRLLALRDPAPGTFAPVEPNRDPPRIERVSRARLPAGFEAISLAANARGALAVLAWKSGEEAALFTLEGGRFALRGRTTGLHFPWSIAWDGSDRVAVMASDGAAPARQAFVYDVSQAAAGDVPLLPEGRTYPFRVPWPVGFCNRIGNEPVLLTGDPMPVATRRLLALSGARYAREGSVLIGPIDSGEPGCIWHRIYAEASVPAHARIRVDVLASEGRAVPILPGQPDAPDWAPHVIGAASGNEAERSWPRAAWCAEPSELPMHPGTLSCPQRKDESGLFTLLVHHDKRRVRRITGRYAWLHVTLEGDSRVTAELAALRIYAKRFSYRDRYLPDFYFESLAGPDALAEGPATPPDFLDRMLGMFEGSLTEIEGRIAGSWLLTDPASAPAEALPWIGSWIGLPSDATQSSAQYRQSLLAAPHSARLHGTLGGLLAALEFATGGICLFGGQVDGDSPPDRYGSLVTARLEGTAIRGLLLGRDDNGRNVVAVGGSITKGDIVVVEGFRMRRTFATILGADLADENDPLTLGLATSGNSYVGDTLILGDKAQAELLSLYSPEINAAQAERDGMEAFFEKLAHRVMVLVRGVEDASEMKRLHDIVAEAVPAHVEPKLHPARLPLIVGAASLVGIDTYLTDGPEIGRVRLNHSIVGEGDQVRGEGWLDGRADGPLSPAPRAAASGPRETWTGAPFILSGLKSSAAAGRAISHYVWTWEA